MAKRILYDYGLPFEKVLAKNIDIQFERIKNNRASLIIIDGAVGTGKTTLATEILYYANGKYNKGEPKLEIKEHPQIALGGKEFTGHFRVCHELGHVVLIYDEGGDFSRRGAITQFNAMLNRLFETYRGFKIMIIICLPNFNVLDNQLFDNQIPRILIHITGRTNRQGDFNAYSLSQMNWIRYWFDKLPKGAKHKCYGKCIPNFRGHFLNLPKEIEKKLDKLSTYGKEQLLKGTEIEMQGLWDYVKLSKELKRSIVWIRVMISKHKIKEKKIIYRKKYFDESTVSILADLIEKQKEEKRNNAKT